MIVQQLERKIDHEYEVFKMNYIVTSRENIFIHAEEISTKKSIYHHLKKNIKRYESSPDLSSRLITMENILDNAYGYLCDQRTLPGVPRLDEWLRKCKEGRQ